ncbi:MAG TPA: FlgD immunoglobulin-like domain containing protein [Candidatus Deferrimicrobium sp.]|nr:FlgD immunoglobulin-like domain containing protein [Candidatus Deferrimicrobium sp.]
MARVSGIILASGLLTLLVIEGAFAASPVPNVASLLDRTLVTGPDSASGKALSPHETWYDILWTIHHTRHYGCDADGQVDTSILARVFIMDSASGKACIGDSMLWVDDWPLPEAPWWSGGCYYTAWLPAFNFCDTYCLRLEQNSVTPALVDSVQSVCHDIDVIAPLPCDTILKGHNLEVKWTPFGEGRIWIGLYDSTWSRWISWQGNDIGSHSFSPTSLDSLSSGLVHVGIGRYRSVVDTVDGVVVWSETFGNADFDVVLRDAPPRFVDNEVVRIHFEHSLGMIDSLTFKLGSNQELLDQYWDNTNGRGLGRIHYESGTVCTSWSLGADSAVFHYSNTMYGSKTLFLRWGLDIGFEMSTEYQIEKGGTFSAGALWEPGGDNWTPYDSLAVKDPGTGWFKMMIHYPGGYRPLHYGSAIGACVWDSRYDEILGYWYFPERYIECGTGLSMDGPFYELVGPDTITVGFAVKDSLSFWQWAEGYDHNVGVAAILSPSGIIPQDTIITPAAVIRNYGREEDTFSTIFTIGSPIPYVDTQVITLSPGEKDTILFQDWIANTPGTFIMACSTALAGDEYSNNDRERGSVTVSPGEGPEIYSITPNVGGNTGSITVEITGARFEPGATVKLSKDTLQDIVADAALTTVLDSSTVVAILDLRDQKFGDWNVVVTNPTGAPSIFYGGFTIEEGFEQLWVEITGRDQIRAGRRAEYLVSFGNTGNVDAYGIILSVRGIPAGGTLEPLFELDYPAQPDSGDSIAWREAPLVFEDSGKLVMILFIPRVAAGEQVDFPFGVQVPSPGPIHLEAAVSGPLAQLAPATSAALGWSVANGSLFEFQAKECLLTIVKEVVIELVPKLAGTDCLEAIGSFLLGTLDDIMNRETSMPKPISFPHILARPISLVLSCADEGLGLFTIIAKIGDVIHSAQDSYQACEPFLKELWRRLLSIFAGVSWDPNDKAGPTGFGDSSFVAVSRACQYVVYFENDSAATAAAEDVIITDTLDRELDWSTFSFASTSHSSTSQSFDPVTGVIRWIYEDINLPPNVTPPEGEGYVSYSVKPLDGLSTGTRIENLAWITFDFQTWAAPMDSIPIFNTIDANVPTSHVVPFADSIGTPSTEVSWTGSDPGAGIGTYQVYMADSVDGSPGYDFELWKTTDDTSATLDFVEDGHIYSFYSVAIDHVGHREQKSDTVEAQIRIVPTDVTEGPDDLLPKRFALSQNYPNPFNATTVIRYDLPKKAKVELTVYNILGQEVTTLVEKEQPPGSYEITWGGANEQGETVATGIYLYRIKAEEFVQSKKMLLLK